MDKTLHDMFGVKPGAPKRYFGVAPNPRQTDSERAFYSSVAMELLEEIKAALIVGARVKLNHAPSMVADILRAYAAYCDEVQEKTTDELLEIAPKGNANGFDNLAKVLRGMKFKHVKFDIITADGEQA